MRRIDDGKVCVLTRGDLEVGRGEKKKKKKNSPNNPCGDVWLNLKKSAEVIVLTESVGREESAETLLERIISRTNMAEAYKRVVKNHGSSGIDKMTVEAMYAHLKEHYAELVQSISKGSYKPGPVKRVNIPKPDGGQRKLGIPTAIDRMVQQAISQILTPIFEKKFSDNSYGFRPGRNAHQAIV